MVNQEHKLKIVAEAFGFKNVQKELSLLSAQAKTIGDVTRGANRMLGTDMSNIEMTKVLGINKKFFHETNQGIQGMATGMKKLHRPLKEFRMEWLSVMFMSMAVWKVFKEFFKGMIDNYKMLDKKGNKPLTRALNKMSAAWVYLRYTMMDAFGPSLTAMMIKLAELMMFLADLDPETLEKIVMALAILAALSFVGLVGSQFALFAAAVSNLATTNTKGLATTVGLLTKLARLGTIVVGLTLIWGDLENMLDGDASIFSRIVSAIKTGIMGALVFAAWPMKWGKFVPRLGVGLKFFVPIMIGAALIWGGVSGMLNAADLKTFVWNALGTLLTVFTGAGLLAYFGKLAALGVAAGSIGGAAAAGGIALLVTLPIIATIKLFWDYKKGEGPDFEKIWGEDVWNDAKPFATDTSALITPWDPNIDMDEDLKKLGDAGYEATNKIHEGIAEVQTEIESLAELATPEAIEALNSLFETGGITHLGSQIKTDLLPELKELNPELGILLDYMLDIQEQWDQWDPLHHEVHITYYHHNIGGGSNLSSRTQVT